MKAERRLTDMGALELAIAVAQYFYYERDTPIMADAEYDELEKHYRSELKKAKGTVGVMNVVGKPGSAETLKQWLLHWRDKP